ncbi:MAG: hypothetical protein HY303_18410 [Candidatus Wallbacteria bacterium]|nr:hypothetical protein [Candidatus Wallbacteria bacterium]
MTSPRMAGAGRGAVTLIEMMFFGAIAAIVLVGAIGILSKGSHILEVGRRTSGSQVDLRLLLETLSDDANELVYLEDGAAMDSGGSGGDSLKLVVKSTRNEVGLTVPPAPSLRKIEYKLGAVEPRTKLRECTRTVSVVDPGTAGGGTPVTRTVARSIAKMRVWPVAAIPLPDKRYQLVAASDNRAKQPGATVACLVVDVTVGLPSGTASSDSSSVTSVVTKIWSRNRVLEIARGGLQ